MLLNETFSTTSFEEGYYIARDSVKALLAKGVRTIYNTHMHKLGEDAEKARTTAIKDRLGFETVLLDFCVEPVIT